MKTVLAALAISSLVVAPASASGTPDVGGVAARPEPMRMTAVVDVVPAPITQAASAKKVRIVLASPYGN
ncbi:MAG: hypothetical protein EOO66_14320 [Methylobacterium sp.]|nr:MAG: hypothetical protein EOO66_14320 [Methylobacterium sp.]